METWAHEIENTTGGLEMVQDAKAVVDEFAFGEKFGPLIADPKVVKFLSNIRRAMRHGSTF